MVKLMKAYGLYILPYVFNEQSVARGARELRIQSIDSVQITSIYKPFGNGSTR